MSGMCIADVETGAPWEKKPLLSVTKTQPCGLRKLVTEGILFYLQDKLTYSELHVRLTFSDKETFRAPQVGSGFKHL